MRGRNKAQQLIIKPKHVGSSSLFDSFSFYSVIIDTMDCHVQKKKDTFSKEKVEFLKKEDLSKKGSIDSLIVDVVNQLNQDDNFYTTSSCSGRLIIIAQEEPSDDIKINQKKGCNWIMTSHEKVTSDDIMESLKKLESEESRETATLKFEPFILHVCCRNVALAKQLMETSVASGFRNSGISISKKDRIIVAIRSCPSFQVPLYFNQKIMVSREYIEFLNTRCNLMFDENLKRIQLFQDKLMTMITDYDHNK